MENNTRVVVKIDNNKIIKRMETLSKKGNNVLKSQIVRDTNQFVPFKRGDLRRSVNDSVSKNDNILKWKSIYARFMHEGKVMVGRNSGSAWARRGETKITTDRDLTYSQGGSKWFEKSKSRNINTWLKLYRGMFK